VVKYMYGTNLNTNHLNLNYPLSFGNSGVDPPGSRSYSQSVGKVKRTFKMVQGRPFNWPCRWTRTHSSFCSTARPTQSDRFRLEVCANSYAFKPASSLDYHLPNPSLPIMPPPPPAPPRRPKPDSTDSTPKSHHFDGYVVRKVALKFCYSGSEYNGLAFQPEPTPFPTVEGVLFGVLA
jgi:hypothetical protein